jgi:drug/metabolite transporter (DMT)-like permease
MILDRTFGYVLAITAVLLWAVFSNVAKYLFQQGLAVTDLTTIRIVIAAGVLWTVACFNPVGAFRSSALSASNPPRGAWPFLIAFGLSLWAMMFTFYQAISYLGVALGVIIQFTHPLLIILFGAAVLGERITRIAVVAVTCIMVGVILIVQVFEAGQVQVSGIGVVWGLISAVANAAYLLLGRYVQNRYQTGPSLLWGFAVAAVLAVVWRGAQGNAGVGILLGSAENLLSGIGIGVFGTLAAFVLMLLATRYISPLEVGLASGFEAVFAGLLAAWWFGERLSALQLLGAALVIAGVSLTYLRGVQAKAPTQARVNPQRNARPSLAMTPWRD